MTNKLVKLIIEKILEEKMTIEEAVIYVLEIKDETKKIIIG